MHISELCITSHLNLKLLPTKLLLPTTDVKKNIFIKFQRKTWIVTKSLIIFKIIEAYRKVLSKFNYKTHMKLDAALKPRELAGFLGAYRYVPRTARANFAA